MSPGEDQCWSLLFYELIIPITVMNSDADFLKKKKPFNTTLVKDRERKSCL